MQDFKEIKDAVTRQFNAMARHQLYRVAAERKEIDGVLSPSTKDTLYVTYLASFPAGTNPMYKERTEHDCQCCKSFIRTYGDVVAIIDGKLVSVWDINIGGFYQVVADAMSALVKSTPVADIFLHTEPSAGLEDMKEGWSHFYAKTPAACLVKGVDIGTRLSVIRSAKEVMQRALLELTNDSINTVLELMAQNILYRGEEHKFLVTSFRDLKAQFDKCKTPEEQSLFCWAKVINLSGAAASIRNSAIGTLLTDLSEGKELEYAVKSYESKVAPTNYKRPTALVTKAMIEKARTTIAELGYASALERRFANLQDITINNVLFADRAAKKKMAGDVFDLLAGGVAEKVKNFDRVEEIGIEDFLKKVVPLADSIEVMLENRHTSNLVSLIAPVDPAAKSMFKWPNNFSWAYNGEVADSYIRSEVQARGGSVSGAFRFSHSWNHDKRNASLMDLHVFMPGNPHHSDSTCHDKYGNDNRIGWNLRKHHLSGGVQDVDYTSAAPKGYVPVENITFPELRKMPEGEYICKIHNWNLRAPTEGGFKAEIEFGGEVFQYELDRPMKHKEWVTVAKVTLRKGLFTIEHCLPVGSAAKEVWGISTQSFHKVEALMMSPNYWDDRTVGNKHYFFMLSGCLNDGTARGFFNEFLSEELNAHRKVLEMVGSKMKTSESDRQLSGVGFSSTQRNSVLCRVTGTFSRVVKVVF